MSTEKVEEAQPQSLKFGNYVITWTDLHLPRAKINPLRYQYDELGHEALGKLQAIFREQKTTEKGNDGQGHQRMDACALLRDYHTRDPTLAQLWDELHSVPDWVDWAQIERGQRFFYRYAPAAIMGFALQGFVGENSGASGVVEVLVRTGGFSTRVLLRRLLETFQLILQATESLEAIQPGGAGHTTAIRVRLLHSSARQRILTLAETRPDYFDISKFGVPINTLDSIHSIATFSCNHMWLQLPMMGIHPRVDEIADYIALWRYVGYLLATPDQYFVTPAQAKATMESMVVQELCVTPNSRVVGHNFIECLKDLPPVNISSNFIAAGSRVFNGHELCDELGLEQPGWYAYACFRGFCWFVASLVHLQNMIPAFDRAVINFFRTTLHRGVIHNEGGLAGGSKLDFKYVPTLGRLTDKEGNSRKSPTAKFLGRPFEAFCFIIFALGCLTLLSGGLAFGRMLIYMIKLGEMSLNSKGSS